MNKQNLTTHYQYKEAVEAFIQRYSNIPLFIKHAIPYLIKHFGSPLDIILEVMSYPEEHAEDELVAWIKWIKSDNEVEAALDKLDKFNNEWFLDRMGEVDYRFNFNIEGSE